MKGLQEQTDSGVVFLTIKHNSIVQESKGPKEGFESVKVTNPRTKEEITKYIKRYSALEAAVSKMEWYDTEQKYDNRYQGFKVHMDANETPVVLDLPFNSRATSRFMKLAENINWGKPVEFRAWRDIKTDSTAFWVGQDNENVPQRYTRDNPHDLPPPTKNGRGTWNYDAQMDFLQKKMIEVVIPAVQKANEWRAANPKPPSTTITEPTVEEKPFDFEELKQQLKELSEETPDKSKDDLLEEWFDTRSWAEVLKMHPQELMLVQKKIIEHLLPF